MRRLLLGLGVVVALAVVGLYAFKAPLALHFANAYLHDKNISIASIKGNFWHTLEIETIALNATPVISTIACQWSAWELFNQTIAIDSCVVKDVDINQTLAFSRLFGEDNTTQSTPSSWKIAIEKLQLNASYGDYRIELEARIREGRADIQSTIDTPYLQNIILQSRIDIQTLHYNGTITHQEEVFEDYSEILDNLAVDFKGDKQGVVAELQSEALAGSFVTHDFNRSVLTLYTKERLKPKALLPESLQTLEANFVLTSNFALDRIRPIYSYLSIDSNAASVQLYGTYDEAMGLKGWLTFPKDSILHRFDNRLHLDKIGKIELQAQMDSNQTLTFDLKSKRIQANLLYLSNTINAHLQVASQSLRLKGNPNKKLNADINITSLSQLLKTLKPIYALETPRLKGDLFANATLTNQKNIRLNLRSSSLSIDKNKISDIQFKAKGNTQGLTIQSYQLNAQKMKFFATKPSTIRYKDGVLGVDKFWLNDALWAEGNYKQSKGAFRIVGEGLKLKHPDYIDTTIQSDAVVLVERDNIDIKGDIKLNGGSILYKMQQNENFALDKDIVFLHKSQKKAPDNLRIDLTIETLSPLLYKTDEMSIQAHSHLKLTKEKAKDIRLKGSIKLIDWSSYYTLQNKTLRLSKSAIHFKGDPTEPILDIKAHYNTGDAKITILVVGTPTEPILNFSSTPFMSKEEILSVLLLDTSQGARLNKTEDLQYLLGGALAKSFLSNLGLRVEHFVISDSKFEVGKKIGDKITIIYLGDEVSSVKILYEHSKNIEADFIINKESSSMDIFYKGEM